MPTPREEMIAALELRQPERIPTFELDFQLCEELCGFRYLRINWMEPMTTAERERLLTEYGENLVGLLEKFEFSCASLGALGRDPAVLGPVVRRLRQCVGDHYMIAVHGDATFAIPSGTQMMDFFVRLFEHPEEVHAEAAARVDAVIETSKRLVDMGVDCFILCSDYCFNTGPFLSPKMFAEFITPYLEHNIRELRALGAYVIKHTDGDIMPILDQMVACRPHAIHSLDPMAGVDIREVKRLYGDQVCLIGNVQCNLLQEGPDEALVDSAEYCLRYGAPGGGYIFATSNTPFKGMPPENYTLIWNVWKKWRSYADRAALDQREWPERPKRQGPTAQALLR